MRKGLPIPGKDFELPSDKPPEEPEPVVEPGIRLPPVSLVLALVLALVRVRVQVQVRAQAQALVPAHLGHSKGQEKEEGQGY
jgi:hypothetical protein